jgi:hypothetical protein
VLQCAVLCRPTLTKRLGGHLGTPEAKHSSSLTAAAAAGSGDAGADAAKPTRCACMQYFLSITYYCPLHILYLASS